MLTGGSSADAMRTSENLASAFASFELAVSLDPDFALAWVAIAETRLLNFWYGSTGAADTLEAVETATQRAIGIDPRWARPNRPSPASTNGEKTTTRPRPPSCGPWSLRRITPPPGTCVPATCSSFRNTWARPSPRVRKPGTWNRVRRSSGGCRRGIRCAG